VAALECSLDSFVHAGVLRRLRVGAQVAGRRNDEGSLGHRIARRTRIGIGGKQRALRQMIADHLGALRRRSLNGRCRGRQRRFLLGVRIGNGG